MNIVDPRDLDRLLLCWGKTAPEGAGAEVFHPVLYHMLDVGNVARVLLGGDVSPRWARILAKAFGDDPVNLHKWLPWAISMHDIGKVSSPFQAQVKSQEARLLGLGFKVKPILEIHHTLVGQVHLEKMKMLQLPQPVYRAIFDMVGGHHGQFPAGRELQDAMRRLQRDENVEWGSLRETASVFLRDEFLSADVVWPHPKNISAATMALCGFTVLCDWIGSNNLAFPIENQINPSEYIHKSETQAQKAVEMAGFKQPAKSKAPISVGTLFSNLPSLRPLQAEIDHIPQEVFEGPCIAIIEAPTGEGKTEAALALAHRIAVSSGSDELYYALPTSATSNQMFIRLNEHLFEHLHLPVQAKLVHSQAFLIEDEIAWRPLVNGQDQQSPIASLEWFSSKKRALLAPFGVGTIDQAELGALNVRHNMLRLVGLAGKVLILDEVHAFDTYMTTIIERLLAWLAAMGTSVIILSATLPQSRRDRLMKAYGVVNSEGSDVLRGYPCLWVGRSGKGYASNPPASQPGRRIALQSLQLADDDPEWKARWLLEKMGDEGCVCWITNTIDRAQKLFSALDAFAPSNVRRLLIHSRFPVEDRQALETELAGLYGPKGDRPNRGIVVGTQVLEQSLDLDFDLMVSDLAPVDLLLQRAGRLHRHQRSRPSGHGLPVLIVNSQLGNGGNPDLRADEKIYHSYFLLKTWKVLQEHDHFDLPADYRTLIQVVYDAPPDTQDADLIHAFDDLKQREIIARQEAEVRLLPVPDASTSFTTYRSARIQFEEDEDKAGWIIARTRLGDETVTILPLEEQDGHIHSLGAQFSFSQKDILSNADQLALLRRSMKVSSQDVVKAIQSQAVPLFLKNAPLLKNVYPLWFNENLAEIQTDRTTIQFQLDPRLGLVIRRQKG